MRKNLLALLFVPFLLVGCGGQAPEAKSVENPRLSGEIGAFNLTSPENDFHTNKGFTFTWEEASNSEYYAIEICAEETFYNDKNAIYVKESNLAQNKYDLNYSLQVKDIDYYWRVTAYNKDHTKVSNQIGKFHYESVKVSELPIVIEDAQDWAVHKEGAQATVSIDQSNFFGNDQNSLVISFTKEETYGLGWIVVTKTEDRELYGTDAFYLNFYYSGHDSNVLIRVLDADGEYWHNQVQIANGAKQTIVMKYEDFQLRTATNSPIMNKVFDWQHIHYFEIVFEKTFGDGVCMLSDIKAVKYSDYSHMFMSKMDFREHPTEDWTYNNYNFEKTISEDGSELTLGYYSKDYEPHPEINPNGFAGYGFQSVDLYKYFTTGDTLRMKVKYTGSSTSAIFYFRIYEEDNDTWQFKTPFSNLIKDEYRELVIPLAAFTRMAQSNGDGAKQFYFVKKFIIGLSDNYSSGTLAIKDLEMLKIADIVPSTTKAVKENGCIEDFNDYEIYSDLYTYWTQSLGNKDEQIALDTVHRAGGFRNTYCAEFSYKADMEAAMYQIKLDGKATSDKNAFQIWLNDTSTKSTEHAFDYLERVSAEMTIQLTLDTGEKYRYYIPAVEHEWHKYTIPFEKFELSNEKEIFTPQPLKAEKVVDMGFAFQYFYKNEDGSGHPTYLDYNKVYIDEIYFVNTDAKEVSIIEIESTIKTDTDNENRVTIDTFEDYSFEDEIFDYWMYATEKDYNEMALSNEVSSQGDSHSLRMHYKGSESVSYLRSTLFAQEVTAMGVVLDLKADAKATIYFNLNFRSGSTVYKMRYSIVPSNYGASSDWYHIELGFSNFKDINGSKKTVTSSTAKDIESFSFGIVNSDGTESDIYIDNLRMVKDITYSTKTFTVIE